MSALFNSEWMLAVSGKFSALFNGSELCLKKFRYFLKVNGSELYWKIIQCNEYKELYFAKFNIQLTLTPSHTSLLTLRVLNFDSRLQERMVEEPQF